MFFHLYLILDTNSRVLNSNNPTNQDLTSDLTNQPTEPSNQPSASSNSNGTLSNQHITPASQSNQPASSIIEPTNLSIGAPNISATLPNMLSNPDIITSNDSTNSTNHGPQHPHSPNQFVQPSASPTTNQPLHPSNGSTNVPNQPPLVLAIQPAFNQANQLNDSQINQAEGIQTNTIVDHSSNYPIPMLLPLPNIPINQLVEPISQPINSNLENPGTNRENPQSGNTGILSPEEENRRRVYLNFGRPR